jgi:hypothetical protein
MNLVTATMAPLTSDNSSPNPSLPPFEPPCSSFPEVQFIHQILALAKKVKIYAPNHSPCPAKKMLHCNVQTLFHLVIYFLNITQNCGGFELQVATLPLSSAETESDSSSFGFQNLPDKNVARDSQRVNI